MPFSVGAGYLARSFLVATLLTLFACGGDLPTVKPLGDDAVILAFGDSLTHGTGVTPQQSYPSVLASMVQRRVINGGVPGEITADGVRRLPGLLEEHRPSLVVLIHGGNDLLRRLSEQSTANNLRQMIDDSRRRGADVVMLGVPRPTLLLSAASFYESIAQEKGVPIDIDAVADILQYPANKSDAIHPNAQGYRMMAERVSALLAENGAL